MISKDKLKNSSIKEIIEEYPYTESFFEDQKLAVDDKEKTLKEIFSELTIEEMEDSIRKVEHHDSVVNHSAKTDIFAINFAHLYKVAADLSLIHI